MYQFMARLLLYMLLCSLFPAGRCTFLFGKKSLDALHCDWYVAKSFQVPNYETFAAMLTATLYCRKSTRSHGDCPIFTPIRIFMKIISTSWDLYTLDPQLKCLYFNSYLAIPYLKA